MPPSERDRIVRLIQIGIDRYDTKLREAYDIEIDPNQSGIDSLRDFRRIDQVTWDSPPAEGINPANVQGMNAREPVTASIDVSFVARPSVVVATSSLRRGHVISMDDVVLMPAARNVPINDVFTDVEAVIGLQVQSVIQKDRPINRTSLGPVVVVERGDLVEVRVIGGGITIATGAKSLAPGAIGDLVAIETLEPKRKLMARVASHGVVEIVTRPPRVR
jgi:flagellar basal body P-ring formation protein FlgA